MKHLAAAVLIVMAMCAPAFAQVPCNGVPGLAAVAAKLKVKPSVPTATALPDCNGRSYEIGALLGAAVERIEAAERKADEAIRISKANGSR